MNDRNKGVSAPRGVCAPPCRCDGEYRGAGRLVADIEHGGGLLEEERRCRLQLENRIASALVPAAALCPSALR